MKTIKINLSRTSYEIKLGEGILRKLPDYLEEIGFSGRLVIICDTVIEKLHLDTLKSVLNNSKIAFETVVIKTGEEYKTLDTVSEIYESLAKLNISRKDTILAFGGGVTGDISGFVAATYLRGVDYIQVPTTLLSMVDSSIGGKTGVDLKYGKNLVGAFKQPRLVIADTNLLKTLPELQLASGMAEIIKAGLIRDNKLIEILSLSQSFEDDKEEIILRAINVKKEIVEADEFEKYERMLLNFGHTFGHAIEKYYGFKGITHGQAVAFGMKLITKNDKINDLLDSLYLKFGLEMECQVPQKEIIRLSKNDKKASGDSVNIVIVEKPGEGIIKKISFSALEEEYV
ncbi:MAG: 3-dehydroquinate synthase [Ruminococcaceae bacterium]|nr:3-dehydroquinate synthase [Oscillospiraceae bacterium]